MYLKINWAGFITYPAAFLLGKLALSVIDVNPSWLTYSGFFALVVLVFTVLSFEYTATYRR